MLKKANISSCSNTRTTTPVYYNFPCDINWGEPTQTEKKSLDKNRSQRKQSLQGWGAIRGNNRV